MANTIVINDDLRTMTIPSDIVLLGVESDDDVQVIQFQMPKIYNDFDLSTFEARVNYLNANNEGDLYIADDLAEDGDDPSLMNFTWLVGRNACAYEGDTKFIVCLKKFDDDQNVVQEFNTTVYSLPVLEGLETTEAVIQEYPDIIEQILQKIEAAGLVDFSDYYTKEEVDALKLPNPQPITINGTAYDGSEAVDLTINDGTAETTATVSGKVIHVDDAMAGEALKSLELFASDDSAIASAAIAIANKNLFRIDALSDQTVSKGITFAKYSDGSIHASGTSTGTYAATTCGLDANMFEVGKTYTISTGKRAGYLYVQLAITYTDNTTDYLVARNSSTTFTVSKPIQAVTASVQITDSGVTLNDEVIYPQLEMNDAATPFVMNTYTSMIYDGTSMPVLPALVSNMWANDNSVANIEIEYVNDMNGRIEELQNEIDSLSLQLNAGESVAMTTDQIDAITG